MNDVLFIQEPEGSIRCNECGDLIGDEPEVHAREVHHAGVLQVVHPDDI